MMQQYLTGEMRKWLLECFDEEYDQEQIRELSFEQCVKAINRYYDGGYKAFLSCYWAEVEA